MILRDHACITLIIVCYHDYPILLVVIVGNILLCLIYKLNSIRGINSDGKKQRLYGNWYYPQFQASPGDLRQHPLQIRGLTAFPKLETTGGNGRLFTLSLTGEGSREKSVHQLVFDPSTASLPVANDQEIRALVKTDKNTGRKDQEPTCHSDFFWGQFFIFLFWYLRLNHLPSTFYFLF